MEWSIEQFALNTRCSSKIYRYATQNSKQNQSKKKIAAQNFPRSHNTGKRAVKGVRARRRGEFGGIFLEHSWERACRDMLLPTSFPPFFLFLLRGWGKTMPFSSPMASAECPATPLLLRRLYTRVFTGANTVFPRLFRLKVFFVLCWRVFECLARRGVDEVRR